MCVVRVRELAPDDFSGEHNHDCANEYCYVLVVELCDIAGPYLVWRVGVEVTHHAVPNVFAQIPAHCFCSRRDAVESHLLHEFLDFFAKSREATTTYATSCSENGFLRFSCIMSHFA